MNFNEAIATLQRVQAEKERKREYMREYMREYQRKKLQDPVYQELNRARSLKVSVEEYRQLKAQGCLKQGRPRKALSV